MNVILRTLVGGPSLCAVLLCVVVSASPRMAIAGEDVAAQIKRLSQEFSDASATANTAVFERDLDDNVVFVDENGTISTKKDVLGSTPLPAGFSLVLVQTDFHVVLHDDVAVTSFTDNATLHAYGQAVRTRYRSTEVWLHEGSAWKMISSQTIALQDDPPAVTLPPAVLDEYVGTYRAPDGSTVSIARAGSDLTSSLNGGKSADLRAEVKDVFFVSGQPRIRRIFDRDASGKITAYLSRHEGHDLVFTRVA